ncbi:MAG: hypothetical protein GDA37_02500 [Ekhidna sp.]|nr:hypothetical protein [Ekhidna sp.]
MKYLTLLLIISGLLSCENKNINEGEEFRPRPLQDSFDNSHFTKVTVDGVEYLMMERDNNNPHEGFGFMAFRANILMERQDSIMSYLKAMQYFQNKIYSRMYNISEEEAQIRFDQTFSELLLRESTKLKALKQESFIYQEEAEK